MLASNPGERKLTEPDFPRLKRVAAAGAFPQRELQPEASSDCAT